MNLPGLDQTIELQRGEAGELREAVAWPVLTVFEQLQAQQRTPLPDGLFLALPVLMKLATRLSKQVQAEKRHVGVPSRKPRSFRLSYLEVAAIRRYVLPVATMAHVPLGKVHQVSLNLEEFIDFT